MDLFDWKFIGFIILEFVDSGRVVFGGLVRWNVGRGFFVFDYYFWYRYWEDYVVIVVRINSVMGAAF